MRRPTHQNRRDFRTSIGTAGHTSGHPHFQGQPHTTQRGTALVMSLIFLLILTILGVTAMTTSSLQEKMAGNLRDQFMAMEAAESALRAGEQWLLDYRTRFGANSEPSTMCPGSNDPTDPQVWATGCLVGGIDAQTDSWWTSAAVAYDSIGLGLAYPISQVAAQPRYIIEFNQFVEDRPVIDPNYKDVAGMHYYTISGWSFGATQSARALIQNTFRRRFDK